MFNETGLIEDCSGTSFVVLSLVERLTSRLFCLFSELSPMQTKDLHGWVDFYRTHEVYFQVGKLIGFYYDESGESTSGRNEVLASLGIAQGSFSHVLC